MQRPTRPSADKTRTVILKAARKCFLAKGFAGASMQMIAKAAKVNQNLIFHHFQNKQNLWRRVKEDIVGIKDMEWHCDASSLENFVRHELQQRFAVYKAQPDLVRMLQWQMAEADAKDLAWTGKIMPTVWRDAVIELQQRGEITRKLDPDVVMIFMTASLNGLFLQNYFKTSREQQLQYCELAIQSVIAGLKTYNIED